MRFATFLLCLKQAACLIYSIKLAEGEDFDKLQVESAEGTHQLDPSIIQFFTEIAENPGADGYGTLVICNLLTF